MTMAGSAGAPSAAEFAALLQTLATLDLAGRPDDLVAFEKAADAVTRRSLATVHVSTLLQVTNGLYAYRLPGLVVRPVAASGAPLPNEAPWVVVKVGAVFSQTIAQRTHDEEEIMTHWLARPVPQLFEAQGRSWQAGRDLLYVFGARTNTFEADVRQHTGHALTKSACVGRRATLAALSALCGGGAVCNQKRTTYPYRLKAVPLRVWLKKATHRQESHKANAGESEFVIMREADFTAKRARWLRGDLTATTLRTSPQPRFARPRYFRLSMRRDEGVVDGYLGDLVFHLHV